MRPTLDATHALPKDAGYYRRHLLLRDLKARTVWDDIVAWTTNLAARLPSGAGRAAEAMLHAR